MEEVEDEIVVDLNSNYSLHDYQLGDNFVLNSTDEVKEDEEKEDEVEEDEVEEDKEKEDKEKKDEEKNATLKLSQKAKDSLKLRIMTRTVLQRESYRKSVPKTVVANLAVTIEDYGSEKPLPHYGLNRPK